MAHSAGGPGWNITVDTSEAMLMALYLRDLTSLEGAGMPPLSAAKPYVHPADAGRLTAPVGGSATLRTEWETWWESLIRGNSPDLEEMVPPEFPAFRGMPALQRVMQAHYGSALAWTEERRAEYEQLCEAREATGKHRILGQLIEDREMELGRNARNFELNVIELPLSEPRAWYVEPDKLLMSQELVDDEPMFRSFVQPVVEMLV